MTVLLARGITSVPEAEIEEHELRLDLGRPIYVCNPISDQMHHASTLEWFRLNHSLDPFEQVRFK